MKIVAKETPNTQSEVLKRLRRRFRRHINVIRSEIRPPITLSNMNSAVIHSSCPKVINNYLIVLMLWGVNMISKKILSIVLILVVSVSSILGIQRFQASAQDPIANLTGNIYDRGVDTDGDGSFNYIEVSVEVNVADAADYEVRVYGLVATDFSYIDVSGERSEYLQSGIHVVNVSLYGPTIYTAGLNPINVSEITLFWVEYSPAVAYISYWLGALYDVPLSQEFLFTDFDAPFKDVEVSFAVYPEGRVVMDGWLNYTDMEEMNPFPLMSGVASIEKTPPMSEVAANFTFTFPEDEASQFPFNSSSFELLSEYSDGLLSTTITGSTILLPDIASELPFNITDFTVKGEYTNNVVTGNLTVDIWNGFPLDDVVIYFDGNQTSIHINGSTTVVFGTYPDFGEINATILEGMLANLTETYEGQGSSSLFNMTNGILEFTMLNNETTLHTSNATVDFDAKIEGDLIHALVNMTGQPAFLYDLLNATWPSIKSGSLLLTYAHALKQADMEFDFTANMTHIFETLIPFLPDLIPYDEAAFVESLLNTTYCTIDSATVSLSYDDERANLTATATIQDFDAELNYIKTLLQNHNFFELSASQFQTINETQIDLSNFEMSVSIAETSMELDIQGFEVVPPLDWINATHFKLERFFNMTVMDDYEPPIQGEKLKVTVEGRSNATHTVTIFRPGTVPDPDLSSPGGVTWANQSISELKELVFLIGPRDDTDPVIDPPIQTPELPDDGEAVTISVNVTDADTGIPPYGVILSYRTNAGIWTNVTMTKMIGNLFEGEIPGFSGGTYVEYRIIARDYADNEALEDKSGAYYVYTVVSEFPTWQVLLIAALLIAAITIVAKRRRSSMGYSLSQLNQKAHMLLPF